MFKIIEGKMTHTASGKIFDSYAFVFDGIEGKLLCGGSVEPVKRKHESMLNTASILQPDNKRPIFIEFNSPDEEVCETINMLYTHPGYSKIWLKNNGYM